MLVYKNTPLATDTTSSNVQFMNPMCVSLVPSMLCDSRPCFYKSRSETTAFDPRYFQGRLNTNNGCQQVLRPKHRGVFRRFNCPFAAVRTMLSRVFGWWAYRIPRCLGRRTCKQTLLLFNRHRK